MIQDRLTAKFQSAKSAAKRFTRPKQSGAKKPAVKKNAADDDFLEAFERGRRAAGSQFWL